MYLIIITSFEAEFHRPEKAGRALACFLVALVLMIVLAVLSCAFTVVISNAGACTLLVPLGISIANQIGVDPWVAAIMVGLGGNSFILPTHQANALYMGPGG